MVRARGVPEVCKAVWIRGWNGDHVNIKRKTKILQPCEGWTHGRIRKSVFCKTWSDEVANRYQTCRQKFSLDSEGARRHELLRLYMSLARNPGCRLRARIQFGKIDVWFNFSIFFGQCSSFMLVRCKTRERRGA